MALDLENHSLREDLARAVDLYRMDESEGTIDSLFLFLLLLLLSSSSSPL